VTDPEQPWWLRALAPLRSESAMFTVFLGVLAVAVVFVALVVLVRALF
jgi:hypothetical protein